MWKADSLCGLAQKCIQRTEDRVAETEIEQSVYAIIAGLASHIAVDLESLYKQIKKDNDASIAEIQTTIGENAALVAGVVDVWGSRQTGSEESTKRFPYWDRDIRPKPQNT